MCAHTPACLEAWNSQRQGGARPLAGRSRVFVDGSYWTSSFSTHRPADQFPNKRKLLHGAGQAPHGHWVLWDPGCSQQPGRISPSGLAVTPVQKTDADTLGLSRASVLSCSFPSLARLVVAFFHTNNFCEAPLPLLTRGHTVLTRSDLSVVL